MIRRRPSSVSLASLRRGASALLLLLWLFAGATPAGAAGPSPSATPIGDVRMSARPLLGGAVRPGAWMAVQVRLENDGPAIAGELQITGGQQRDSRYGVPVELATGARQQHVLYAQPDWTGRGLLVNLVRDGEPLLSQKLTTRVVDAWTPTIVVVAERPEGIVADIRAGTTLANMNPPVILTVTPEELPARVEAWSAIDRLVWQDVDTTLLSEEQLTALRGWVGAGGRMVVAAGTTGTSTLGGLPPDLLPFLPTGTVDAPKTDLEQLLGTLPADATTLPAVAGILQEGTVLGRTGDAVFAAQRSVGQGAVTLLGIDPSTDPIAGSAMASGLWRRFLPTSASGAVVNPLMLTDDSQIVMALSNLPSVDLPDLGVLFALLLLYIALIGPLNYLVLRRLDRREWAWLTMPVLVGIFAVAAYGLGATLKGTDTIVNQVGIVRTAAGTDQGIGQVYVGVFSPDRASYDVRVSDGALLTNPAYLQNSGQTTTPLDVQLGETSRLRDFQVGFSTLRTFRAEAPVTVPRLESDLEYRDGVLTGTLHNRSEVPLEDVAVLFGRTVQRIPTLAPGASAAVDLRVSGVADDGRSLSELVFGPYPSDGIRSRTEMTRRMVLDQIWWSSGMGYGSVQPGPTILGWTSGPELAITLGDTAKQVGDTVHVYPATMRVAGPSVFTNPLMGRSLVASEANEATDQGSNMSLSRGTLTVEWRPLGYGGPLRPTALSMMFTQGESPVLTGHGAEVQPLPPDEQPPQDDPLDGVTFRWGPDGKLVLGDDGTGDEPAAAAARQWDGIPDVQLFDRTTESWVELPHPTARREFQVAEPARYVDETGAFLVRMVNRGAQDMTIWFVPLVRLEGEAA